MTQTTFSRTLVEWQRSCGRRTLPWQAFDTPYERLVSEVMLQQTQVATVIPYYERFLERFPTAESLAEAPEEELMRLWAGLGYYARARNLQRVAAHVVSNLAGKFPTRVQDLLTLPGVGPSTAAAVAAFTSHEAKYPMVDGNVKRVFARLRMIPGRIGQKTFEKKVRQCAKALLPGSDLIADYTQGLMDLGSQICCKRNPKCTLCPVRTFCRGADANPEDFPKPKKTLEKKERHLLLGFAVSTEGLWLRPNSDSIWRGLWVPCVREIPAEESKGLLFPSDFGLDAEWKTVCLGNSQRELTHQRLFIQAAAFISHEGALKAEGYSAFLPGRDELPGMPAPVRTLAKAALQVAGYSV